MTEQNKCACGCNTVCCGMVHKSLFVHSGKLMELSGDLMRHLLSMLALKQHAESVANSILSLPHADAAKELAESARRVITGLNAVQAGQVKLANAILHDNLRYGQVRCDRMDHITPATH